MLFHNLSVVTIPTKDTNQTLLQKSYIKMEARSYPFFGSDIEVKKMKSDYEHEDWTEEAILEEAMRKGFNIVVKNGKKGRWYLKHTSDPMEVTMQKIEKSKTMKSYKNRTLYYIKYREIE